MGGPAHFPDMHSAEQLDEIPRYVPGRGWELGNETISPDEAERILKGLNIPFRRPDPGFRSMKPILSVGMTGTDYIDHVEENLSGLLPGDYLELSREKDNVHDRNTVAVTRDGEKVGYVPRVDNKVIANMMDQDIELFCRLSSIEKDGRHASVCLFIGTDTPSAYLHFDRYDGIKRVPFGWRGTDELRFEDEMDEGTWHRDLTEEELWHLQWGAIDDPYECRRGLVCDGEGALHLIGLQSSLNIVTIHPGRDGEHRIEYIRPNLNGGNTGYEEGLAHIGKTLDHWFDQWTRPVEMRLEDMSCGVQGNIVPYGRYRRRVRFRWNDRTCIGEDAVLEITHRDGVGSRRSTLRRTDRTADRLCRIVVEHPMPPGSGRVSPYSIDGEDETASVTSPMDASRPFLQQLYTILRYQRTGGPHTGP